MEVVVPQPRRVAGCWALPAGFGGLRALPGGVQLIGAPGADAERILALWAGVSPTLTDWPGAACPGPF